MAHCCVKFCGNDSRRQNEYFNRTGKELHFHSFPKDDGTRRRWIHAIRQDEGPNFKVTRAKYVCSDHFTASNYIVRATFCKKRNLKPGAVPSVFQCSTQRARRKTPTKRRASGCKTSASHSAVTGPPVTANAQESVLHVRADHNYHNESIPDQLKVAQELNAVCKSTIAQLPAQTFGLQRFSSDNRLIKFYTGFVSYELLIAFYNIVAQHELSVLTWAQVQRGGEGDCSSNALNSLPPLDQLFMFLHKLRLGSLDQELADKFNVSLTSVSRNTKTWCNLLFVILGSKPVWPTKSMVQKSMPGPFRKLYPNTRVIIDCAELYVQSPASMAVNSDLFSNYKSRRVFKSLVGVTPSGAVSFVSSLCAESIPDKQITIESGILDLLQAGDTVMADRDFLIQDLLSARQCSLVILKPYKQFTAAEAEKNKVEANLRALVQRANRRFKEFHLFDAAIPLNLVGSVDRLWTVACLITNFQGPLIVDSDCGLEYDGTRNPSTAT